MKMQDRKVTPQEIAAWENVVNPIEEKGAVDVNRIIDTLVDIMEAGNLTPHQFVYLCLKAGGITTPAAIEWDGETISIKDLLPIIYGDVSGFESRRK